QVAAAAERIDQRAILGLRHGVDRKVAPLQVVFERDLRGGMHREALVAAPALALSTSERVLLVRLWVQKHREIPADGLEAEADHLLERRADDDVIPVLHR